MRRCLLPRIGFRDNQADGVLIESLEPAFALQILQMTRDRVGWDSGVAMDGDDLYTIL